MAEDLFSSLRDADRDRLRAAGWFAATGHLKGEPMWRSPASGGIFTEDEALRQLDARPPAAPCVRSDPAQEPVPEAPARPSPTRRRYLLLLEDAAGHGETDDEGHPLPSSDYRLKVLLKRALRSYRLRCLSATDVCPTDMGPGGEGT
jgi:hypothetical protein